MTAEGFYGKLGVFLLSFSKGAGVFGNMYGPPPSDRSIIHPFPSWFHHHGYKMRLVRCDLQDHCLRIVGSAAEVRILCKARHADEGWWVEWEVRQSLTEKVNGRMRWSTDQFECAFGLRNPEEILPGHRWLYERYGATAAEQFGYIREDQWLNIPCPGTGHDGDPNVSVYLDEEITAAARTVIDSFKTFVQIASQNQAMQEARTPCGHFTFDELVQGIIAEKGLGGTSDVLALARTCPQCLGTLDLLQR